MFVYTDLVLLLLAQLLRFLIWSLTLRNFIKSGMELLVVKTRLILMSLTSSIVAGGCFFTGYIVYLLIMKTVYDEDVLSCKSPEFVI